jgi:uncharacterized membrane protein YphA (DoxX/SURF4 family)
MKLLAIDHVQLAMPAGQNRGELAALYCFVFLYFVFSGPGALSVDGMMRKTARTVTQTT